MDLDALDQELTAWRAAEVKKRADDGRPPLSSFQKSDPYGNDLFSRPEVRALASTPMGMAIKSTRMDYLEEHADSKAHDEPLLEGLELLEQELLRSSGRGEESRMQGDEEYAGFNYDLHEYPRMVVRDVRQRLRSRGCTEGVVRQMNEYIEQGWQIQLEIARKKEVLAKNELGRIHRTQGAGNELSIPISEALTSARTPRLPEGDSSRRSTARGSDTARTEASVYSEALRTGIALGTVVLKKHLLSTLLLGGKKDDVRVLARGDFDEDEGIPGIDATQSAADGSVDATRKERMHSATELRGLCLMAGVKDKEIRVCFERSELEEALADRLIVMHTAAVCAIRFLRAQIALVEVAELKKQRAIDDAGAVAVQRFLRYKLQHKASQQLLADMRRELRLQDLGADATVLSLIEQV